jgi:haloalkane dehalogenase
VEVLRTPEGRFDDLPDFDFEHSYRDWDGMRLAHLDAGEGPPVVMLHGQPTWSFIYRKVMRPLIDAGYRCIVPDLPGFGRSDKPADESWYTVERHTAAVRSLVEELGLEDVTLVMHDWGGPIGFRIATLELPERIARFVTMDTAVLTGEHDPGDAWRWFRDYVARKPDLPVGRLVAVGCRRRPSREAIAGYDAPFPDASYKAGPRSFPGLIPLTPDAPGAAEGRASLEALQSDSRPALLLWADSDPIFPLEPIGRLVEDGLFATPRELTVIEDAGHFLQEDQGERIGTMILEWLRAGTP